MAARSFPRVASGHVQRPAKYGNKSVEIDGLTFASMKEGRRYGELKLLLRAGEIHNLEIQPEFKLTVNGMLVCKYLADFQYVDGKTGLTVVEDVKSEITRKHPVYRLKVKLLKALTGIEVREV